MTPIPPNPRRALAFASTLAAAALFALAGCASKPPMPSAEMAVAEASVQRANTSGTSDNAPAELQLAVSKLASAREALAAKDNERARQLAEQADVDAQAAELHARAARARKAAQETQDAARALNAAHPESPP
jgi:predicted small lipoprotein YifL